MSDPNIQSPEQLEEPIKESKKMKPRKINAKLLEVGKDFQIIVKGSHGTPPRPDVRIVRFNSPNIKRSVKQLQELVTGLQQKYPKLGFSLEKVQIGKRFFYRFTRKKEGFRDIPVYYSTTLKRLFVPTRYVTRHLKLTRSVILFRLRDFHANYTLGYL
jgi:hypothetical protein